MPPPRRRRDESAAPPLSPVAWVIVLGDLGRSPRMQNHALSLADAGYRVHVVSHHAGAAPAPELARHGRVALHALPPAPAWLAAVRPRFVALILKALQQMWALAALLLFSRAGLPAPALVLAQTPPAIPTLAVGWLATRLRGGAWVVDWHNYGYTLLALGAGGRGAAGAVLVWAAAAFERFFARRADAALCVSRASSATWATAGA